MGYIYKADNYCDKCGDEICEELTKQGKAPEDPDNESTYDSDDFPKSADHESEESDSPQHCANCKEFLENPLTQDGYKYAQRCLNACGENLTPVLKQWADFYGFTYFKNPYSHAYDWLYGRLGDLANDESLVDNPKATQLYNFARDMVEKLDADQIQDLFQSDMEEDDFFKETGWYSSEMWED